jgi:hypothetical protein
MNIQTIVALGRNKAGLLDFTFGRLKTDLNWDIEDFLKNTPFKSVAIVRPFYLAPAKNLDGRKTWWIFNENFLFLFVGN